VKRTHNRIFGQLTKRSVLAAASVTMLGGALTGLGVSNAGASSSTTLTITGWYNGASFNQQVDWWKAAAKVFEKAHPGVNVVVNNIVTDSETDYYAKLDLLEKSSSTSPDVTYEDSFLVGSDAAAGYIRPLPQLLKSMQWQSLYPAFKQITEYNGVPYGYQIETDVQQIYYNVKLFKEAGLSVPWQPKTWQNVVTAAEAIKKHDGTSVIPLWVYTGTPVGEASSFRGFEVFLNGTGDALYDYTNKKWEEGGPGFNTTFSFLAQLHTLGLEEPTSDWSDPNAGTVLNQQLMPAQSVGMAFDGDWVSTEWLPGGAHPWAAGFTDYQVAKIPTPTGAAPYWTNQSGGWTLAVPTNSHNPTLAEEFIDTAMSPSLLAPFDANSGQLPVEASVANSPVFQSLTKRDPLFVAATKYVTNTSYRPGFGPYTTLSADLSAITGEISLGQLTAAQAEQQYAQDVKRAAGSDVEMMSH
jgi:multiple sugar transport system substrate-binding protein